MAQISKQALAHVLWIGGATDSGKSTAARLLAERHHLQVYAYDRRDAAHVEQLAKTDPQYQGFLSATLDERWVTPEPEELFERAVQTFHDRFPLMLADLLALPREPGVIAEGFGLLPGLLAPLLTGPHQAVWLVPTDEFKRASMTRRGKPSFGPLVSDPERARHNLLGRDRLLAGWIRDQVSRYHFTLFEVDGSRSAEEMASLLEQHFAPALAHDSGDG